MCCLLLLPVPRRLSIWQSPVRAARVGFPHYQQRLRGVYECVFLLQNIFRWLCDKNVRRSYLSMHRWNASAWVCNQGKGLCVHDVLVFCPWGNPSYACVLAPLLENATRLTDSAHLLPACFLIWTVSTARAAVFQRQYIYRYIYIRRCIAALRQAQSRLITRFWLHCICAPNA